MPVALSFRAELANQVLARLKVLSESQWALADAIAETRSNLYELAFRVAASAIDLLAEEFGEEGRRVIRVRLDDVEAFLRAAPRPATQRQEMIARGAVLAAYLHDSRGFNEGAFQQLYAPVARFIPFVEVEQTARSALAVDSGDYSVLPQSGDAGSVDHDRKARGA